MKEVLTELAASVIKGTDGDCKRLTEQALAQDLSAKIFCFFP
jgi:hypothetical protein